MATKQPMIPKPKKLAEAEQQNTIKNQEAAKPVAPKFKPYRQVPHVEPDAKIEMSVQTWEELQDFFNFFARPVQAMQDTMRHNMENGTITIRYVDPEGKEVPKADVEAYMKEVKDFLAAGGSIEELYAQEPTQTTEETKG